MKANSHLAFHPYVSNSLSIALSLEYLLLCFFLILKHLLFTPYRKTSSGESTVIYAARTGGILGVSFTVRIVSVHVQVVFQYSKNPHKSITTFQGQAGEGS